MEAPVIQVGIFTKKAVEFCFRETYVHVETGDFLTGEQRALLVGDKIIFNGKFYDELFFTPSTPEGTFDLKQVTIGVNFHWQQDEDQRFQGALKLVRSPQGIVAINQVDVEAYLTSVISSEMNADAPAEFLKAHAVISRSWLLAQVERRFAKPTATSLSSWEEPGKYLRWYDREDHELFDVCADDHCQRYQGVTKSANPQAAAAVAATRGEVLVSQDEICDARFSKCCGGATEAFSTCWGEDAGSHPYLNPVGDNPQRSISLDLTQEADAEQWIRTSPDAFCNTSDQTLLRQILNSFDQPTTDFYRWKVRYTQEELTDIIQQKSGRYFGSVIDLVPMKRGKSGRIEELKIVGTELTLTVGKELEIRRWLAPTHLYSSAFVVDKIDVSEGTPAAFVLTGAGWGHGVGLCQIGAAVMASKGYDYRQILSHYFDGAQLEQRY